MALSPSLAKNKFTGLAVMDLVQRTYSSGFGLGARARVTGLGHYLVDNKSTYILAFGRYQDAELAYFLEHADVNILLKSIKARNSYNCHDDSKAITLVVFEVGYDGRIREKNSVQTMPPMPGEGEGQSG